MPARRKGAASVLGNYGIATKPLYAVGIFDTGVTVHSQQIRALNLAWALVESGRVPAKTAPAPADTPLKIAIVGGGFAGLTLAAGLIKKRAVAQITIFEERDTLLPLQQGSDSRWLHPRIYDWPADGSNASVAMLPVLNWTAARASDVVVQILSEWRAIVEQYKSLPILYCNARHLQIDEVDEDTRFLQIEWVGERRDPGDGRMIRDPARQAAAIGASERFEIVILTVGFGIERDGTISYWRNEELGQPSLDQPRRTYLVSGQGDGAMIDLLRLRISQYRQDRILDELFHDKTSLLGAIREVHSKHSNTNRSGLFASLERLSKDSDLQIEFQQVTDTLTRRLRRDTDVILHLRVKKISELFDPTNTRISFQNKLLVYLLYKCGGFVPSSLDESSLITQYSIPAGNIVRRHGTLRDEQLQRILSASLFEALQKRRGGAIPDPLSQPDHVMWSGGYFDLPGPLEHTAGPDDPIREHWRREYLPGPTALLATAFCAGMAGMLRTAHPAPGRLRVTLHRAITVGNEELLQQICDYQGIDDARGTTSSAARTFPAKNATIGLAYKCRQIIRSVKGIEAGELRSAMDFLNLNTASRSMAADVRFVLAIPILEPEEDRSFTAPSPVVGVIFVDSTAKDFFTDDEELGRLVAITQQFIDGIEQSAARFDRIRNIPLTGLGAGVTAAENIPGDVSRVLEIVRSVGIPRSSGPLQLNFDYSDFVPI